MSADFTKFPFPGIENPHAATLTEAITVDPVPQGFVVLAIKGGDALPEMLPRIRLFAQKLRAGAQSSGLQEITAYREFTKDEWGGAIPFDQQICEAVVAKAQKRAQTSDQQFPALEPAIKMAEGNDMADWIVFLEYATPEQAKTAVHSWQSGDQDFQELAKATASTTLSCFRNMKRYANVSRDPNVIQFFNLFPGPGSVDELWQAWQEALPWFFDTGEMRSSFPLAALDPKQPLLVVNYAHFDSLKHFFLGVAYDPNYLEVATTCYKDRGFKLPLPFFCKIQPV